MATCVQDSSLPKEKPEQMIHYRMLDILASVVYTTDGPKKPPDREAKVQV
ncbi:MAG: hypothetical protein NTW48_06080 [Chloroflexi bacterium]|nr:hypothetical protein [Chloroflexota bacterium]